MREETIIVPIVDPKGRLAVIGTKTVVALWECPKCGKKMGKPYIDTLTVHGQSYAIHAWFNECGHQVPYTELNLVERYHLEGDEGIIDFSLDYHNNINMDINAHDILDLYLSPQQALDISEKLRALATRAYGRMEQDEK
ncbi:hypothetical protein BCP78_0095 [Bacillus phage BCP78]|uniref:Uncharacterized protein n=3 Tax=Tsarbombavirus BCP78 TaxID=1985182 RepID=J9PRB5_9CAUD|nr:hypothetical protein BCP78_0095 [Bacillus phage BCP78]YP_009783458.1 hypothetical protein QLX27_gp085 [Bacillus phage BCU4]AEW47102.1 hypothetical protein BCP78_0095 [Bacillus phage BCP78]AEW47591.1 hypothetical protein BCU4_0085 [Bacillus phage BCU4]AQN32472.1 hypothetical protein BCP12_051 [Bacillus phage BCP12]